MSRKVKIIHPSYKQLDYTLTCNVELGVNSTFDVTDGNIIIDYVSKLNTDEPEIHLRPIPTSHSLSGNVMITDTNDECKMPDIQEISLIQDNGILLDSNGEISTDEYKIIYDFEYVTITHKIKEEDFCKKRCENKIKPILYLYGSWVKNVKIFCFNNSGLIVENTSLGKITIKCRPYENVYDEPIYINGFDEQGNLITSTVVYISYIYNLVYSDDSGNSGSDYEDDENDNDDINLLFISPQKYIIQNEDYKTLKSIIFTCYSTDSNAIITNNLNVVSSNNRLFDFYSYIKNQYGDSNEDINEVKTTTITFTSNGITAKGEIIILPYIDKTNSDILFNNDYNTLNPTVEDEVITTSQDYIFFITSESLQVGVTSNVSWYIYDYPSDIITCYKQGNDSIIVTLLDYAPLNESDNVEITLKNTDGNTCSLLVFSKDLRVEDEHKMYWNEEEGIGTIKCEYYGARAISKRLISSFTSSSSLAINAGVEEYGNWKPLSSRTVNYIVEQWVDNKWIRIDATVVGSGEDNTPTNVYINERPDNPEPYDIRIYTNDTFSTRTEGYVDFYQVSDEATIRLEIIHAPVVKYKVYTDQEGEVVFTPLENIS